MKFVVENESFAQALESIKGCVPRKSLPLLQHVAVEAVGQRVVVRSCNLTAEAHASVVARVEEEGGAAIPGEMLRSIVKQFADGGQMRVDLVDAVAQVESGPSRYALRTLDLRDFPALTAGEPVAEITLAGDTLASLLEDALYAAARDDNRPRLNGVFLHASQGRLTAVGSDERRLGLRAEVLTGVDKIPPVLLPIETVKEMVRLADDEAEVALTFYTGSLSMQAGDVTLTTRLMDSTFPEYQRILPTPGSPQATVMAARLLEATKRAMAVYIGRSNALPSVRIAVADKALHMTSGDTDRGMETIEAQIHKPNAEFFCNAGALVEMLDLWPEDAMLDVQVESARKLVLFTARKHPGRLHIIMTTTR